MSISEFEHKKWEKELKEFTGRFRIPDIMRNQIDLRFRIENEDIYIFEMRTNSHNATETVEIPLIKGSYIELQKRWNIFWKKPDSDWEKFESTPSSSSLVDILNRLVDKKFN